MKRLEVNQRAIRGMELTAETFTLSHLSYCCRSQVRLVRSMAGGFVTANCSRCNKKRKLGFHQFLEWAEALDAVCPLCKEKIVPDKNADGSCNYGFRCDECNHFIWLSDILSHWSDLPLAEVT